MRKLHSLIILGTIVLGLGVGFSSYAAQTDRETSEVFVKADVDALVSLFDHATEFVKVNDYFYHSEIASIKFVGIDKSVESYKHYNAFNRQIDNKIRGPTKTPLNVWRRAREGIHQCTGLAAHIK